MRRLLVLRPEPGASATVKRARERGLEAVAAPLFEVEPLTWQAPDVDAFDGLLLTSANAVRHGGDELLKLRGLEVYAVGEATADAAASALTFSVSKSLVMESGAITGMMPSFINAWMIDGSVFCISPTSPYLSWLR